MSMSMIGQVFQQKKNIMYWMMNIHCEINNEYTQQIYMSTSSQKQQKHLREFEMQFLSRDSSSRHMEIQEGLLQDTIKRQSSKLERKKQSVKSIRKIESDQQAASENETDLGFLNRKKFVFVFWMYLVELCIAYGCTIGLFFLVDASQSFPFFELFFILGLMISISPWSSTNLLMLTAIIITICNKYLTIGVLTYPSIMIIYFAVMILNEEYKVKIIFILALVLQLAFGFALIPGVYVSFTDDNRDSFFYVFPILMLVLRTMIQLLYWMIERTENVFLQTNLFIMGLEYGVILTRSISDIQYWYLMVFFTLQIINERTQFVLGFFISMIERCRNSNSKRRRKHHLSPLPAHASGFSAVNSMHIVCLIYVFSKLEIYAPPYTSGTTLTLYTSTPGSTDTLSEWYKPLSTWALVSVYEILSILLERRRRDKLLVGYVVNSIPVMFLRGFMLVLGFWMFYLGLGIGNYIVNDAV